VKFTTHYVSPSKSRYHDDDEQPRVPPKDPAVAAADKRFFESNLYKPRDKEQTHLESYFDGGEKERLIKKRKQNVEVVDLSDYSEQAKKKAKTSHFELEIDNPATQTILRRFKKIRSMSRSNMCTDIIIDRNKTIVKKSQALNDQVQLIGVLSQQKCEDCSMLVKVDDRVQVFHVYASEFGQIFRDLQKTMTFEGGIRSLNTPHNLRRVTKLSQDHLKVALKSEYRTLLLWNGFEVQFTEQVSNQSSQGKRLLTSIELKGVLSNAYLGDENQDYVYGLCDFIELCEKILHFEKGYMPKFYKGWIDHNHLNEAEISLEKKREIKAEIVKRSLRMLRPKAINEHLKRRAKEVMDKRHANHQTGCTYSLLDCEKVLRDMATHVQSVRDEIVIEDRSEDRPQGDCELKSFYPIFVINETEKQPEGDLQQIKQDAV
jgi:hypothetical protein